MTTIFGGYVVNDDVRVQLDVAYNPDKQRIEKAIRLVAERKGVIKMVLNPAPDIGPFELLLYAEEGTFLLMLNEMNADGDVTVRTLTKEAPQDEGVSLLGDRYPKSATTRSRQLVNEVFVEFAQTGNVSSDSLR